MEPLGKKIWSRSRCRLKKKSGAGAAKKLAGSLALLFSLRLTVGKNYALPNKAKLCRV